MRCLSTPSRACRAGSCPPALAYRSRACRAPFCRSIRYRAEPNRAGQLRDKPRSAMPASPLHSSTFRALCGLPNPAPPSLTATSRSKSPCGRALRCLPYHAAPCRALHAGLGYPCLAPSLPAVACAACPAVPDRAPPLRALCQPRLSLPSIADPFSATTCRPHLAVACPAPPRRSAPSVAGRAVPALEPSGRALPIDGSPRVACRASPSNAVASCDLPFLPRPCAPNRVLPLRA